MKRMRIDKVLAISLLFLMFSIGFTVGVFSALGVVSVQNEDAIRLMPDNWILLDDRG